MADSRNSPSKIAALLQALKDQGLTPEDVIANMTKGDSDCDIIEDQPTPKKRSRPESSKRTTGASTRRTRSTANPSVKKEPNPRNMEARQVIPQMTLPQSFLEENLLHAVHGILEFQGWRHLFEDEVLISEEAVKGFYAGLSVEVLGRYQMARFVFEEKELYFMLADLPEWLGVPSGGYDYYQKGQWPKSVAAEAVSARVMGTDTESSAAMDLPPLQRILHRFIVQNVTPRLQKHHVVTITDFILLDKLVNKEAINLPKIILSHMTYVTQSSNHGLPYPAIVKTILQHSQVYQPKEEVSMSFPLAKDNLEKLGLTFQEGLGWVRRVQEPPVEVVQPADEAKADTVEEVTPTGVRVGELDALRISVNQLAEEVVVLRHSVETERRERIKSEDLADLKASVEMLNKEIVGLKHKMDTFEEKGDYFIKAFKRSFMPPSP